MPALVLVLVLLGGWEAASRTDLVNPEILPAPTSVVQTLVEDRSILAPDLLTTSLEAVLGLLAAVAAGVVIAVAMHQWPAVRRALYPLAVGSQAVPMVVLAAPLILLLGFGLAPKVVVVALVCFFPVTVSLYDGLRAVSPEQRKLLRSLGASRRQVLTMLEARAALPQAFTGLRLAAAVSVIGAVFAEYNGSEGGLGRAIIIANASFDTPRVFAATVLLFVLAVVLYGAFSLIERRLVDWNAS